MPETTDPMGRPVSFPDGVDLDAVEDFKTRTQHLVTAKKPADHKPKAAEVENPPLKVTANGIEWTIDRDVFDDFELLDMLGQIQELDPDDPAAFSVMGLMPAVLRRVLGDAQAKRAMRALRGETGRVSIEAGTDFLGEIFSGINPN